MMQPLHIEGRCVASDEELFANMEAAIARGLPEISEQSEARGEVIALVASGPSVEGQVDVIRKMQDSGTPIVAIKDAHDWLISQEVVPDLALAIDPQAYRWNCFQKKSPKVHYMIASQCHPAMFDHLADCKVSIWHPYVRKNQERPKNKMLIGGGTTSGLRAISLFYVLGYRHFALFGFDSCMSGDKLRVNGTGVKQGDQVIEIKIDPDGEVFLCNLSMALQAEHFQTYYDYLEDVHFYPYGSGLIPAIIRKREEQALELEGINAEPDNDRVSFIHSGDLTQASYRYRAAIPSQEMGASLNDLKAGTLVFSKPQPPELMMMARAKKRGQRIICDFCDDHFAWMHYQEALRFADVVTCSTEKMRERIADMGREAVVIPDPYEYPMEEPHCHGARLLWFGHSTNRESLNRVAPILEGYNLHVVSNFPGSIPWSKETMLEEFKWADIVVMPAADEANGANRTIEAIRQGCFVVAEPHPAINGIPGIWIGDIKEGIEWTLRNSHQACLGTLEAQSYVMERFSPRTVTEMWRSVTKRPTTSDAVHEFGMAGSMLT